LARNAHIPLTGASWEIPRASKFATLDKFDDVLLEDEEDEDELESLLLGEDIRWRLMVVDTGMLLFFQERTKNKQ
jgi:hypothetical protein